MNWIWREKRRIRKAELENERKKISTQWAEWKSNTLLMPKHERKEPRTVRIFFREISPRVVVMATRDLLKLKQLEWKTLSINQRPTRPAPHFDPVNSRPTQIPFNLFLTVLTWMPFFFLFFAFFSFFSYWNWSNKEKTSSFLLRLYGRARTRNWNKRIEKNQRNERKKKLKILRNTRIKEHGEAKSSNRRPGITKPRGKIWRELRTR